MPNLEAPPVTEVYAKSLRTIRDLGSFVVEQTVRPEGQASYELAFHDFETAIAEMLKTDPEFRNWLDINNVRNHEVRDDLVRSEDGTSIVDMVERGIESSTKAAQRDPNLKFQVVRDKCDLGVVKRVNQLQVGETLFGLSMEPKEAMQQHPETCKKLGYKDGLAYWQWYSRVDEQTLIAGSFSVDDSDISTWRELCSGIGMEIPAGESCDTWLNHAKVAHMDHTQAEQLIQFIRQRYYAKRGSNQNRMSANEYVHAHQPLIKQFFDRYYLATAEAVNTGLNNAQLRSFARAMQGVDNSKFKPGVLEGLEMLADSKIFDDEGARLIDSLIRYAAVEELRKGLVKASEEEGFTGFTKTGIHLSTQSIDPRQLDQLIARNVETGVQAGRSYGGCPGQIEFNILDENGNPRSPQEAFGGKDKKPGEKESDSGACEYKIKQCYCCPYDTDGTKLPTPTEVTVKRDENGTATCQRTGCGATMKGNKVTSHGGIYERAMRLASQGGKLN